MDPTGLKILATDLDRTLLPNGSREADSEAIDPFSELTEKRGVLVVYVTVRNLVPTENATRGYEVGYPDILCGDIGTSIIKYGNGEWKFDDVWVAMSCAQGQEWMPPRQEMRLSVLILFGSGKAASEPVQAGLPFGSP
jgi:hydroxymethylpyrimidine pyrophosphatase-like HAD family hydrolase